MEDTSCTEYKKSTREETEENSGVQKADTGINFPSFVLGSARDSKDFSFLRTRNTESQEAVIHKAEQWGVEQ